MRSVSQELKKPPALHDLQETEDIKILRGTTLYL